MVLRAPTIQATAITFTGVSDVAITFSWTKGNGDARIIVCKAGAITATPSAGVTYTASSTFGSGTAFNGGYVVYNGSAETSMQVTNLASATTYYFEIFEYNGTTGAQLYFGDTASGNPNSQATTSPATTPTVQATNLAWNGSVISWTRGNGSFIMVVMKEGSAVDTQPTDGVVYTASSTFGSGTQIGTGNYVVYKGTAANFTIDQTSLTNNVTYHYRAYEFNGGPTTEKYNISTTTGNPANYTTSINWYLYHDTSLYPRKDYPGYASSKVTGQVFSLGMVTASDLDYYYMYFGGAGHLNGDSQDRTYLARKSKTDGLPPHQGWSFYDNNSDGEPDIILEHPTQPSGGNVYLGSVIDLGVGQNPRFYGFYAQKPTSAPATSVLRAESNDLITWTNKTTIITGNANSSSYGFISVANVGGTYHFLLAGSMTSFPATEGRLFAIDYYTSPDAGTTMTLIARDILNGLNSGITTVGDISQFWTPGDGRYHFLAATDVIPQYPGESSLTDGTTTTTLPPRRGSAIREFSFSGFSGSSPYITDFREEGVLYKSTLQGESHMRALSPVFTDGSGNKFTTIFTGRWRSQYAIQTVAEVFINSKILTTYPSSTNVISATTGKEVYPPEISAFYRNGVSDVADPREVLTGTAGSIVGSPASVSFTGIYPNSTANYTTHSTPNLITDTKHFMVKFTYAHTTAGNTTSEFGLFAFTDPDGSTGWYARIWHNFLEVYVKGAAGATKKYRLQISAANNSGVGHDAYFESGFIWDNGTLTILHGYRNDVSVTKVTDNSFTDIAQPTSKILYIGYVPNTTNPYNKYFSQNVTTWNGASNCTFANWLKVEYH